MREITLQKDSGISVHQQLVTQLAMQIAGGQLAPGEKLPSIRSLGKRLGVHYNTCLGAYQELQELGMLVLKRGSGAQVATFDSLEASGIASLGESLALHQMARLFVQLVNRHGYGWEEVLQALAIARKQLVPEKKTVPVFVDRHPDILPLFQKELGDLFGAPITVTTLDRLEQENLPPDTGYLTSRYHVRALQERVGEEAAITVMDVASGAQEKARVQLCPDGELVVVASVSSIVLQQAEAVIHALRGHDILLRLILYPEPASDIETVLRHAGLIFADVLCAPKLKALTRKPVHLLTVVPPAEATRLKAMMIPGYDT